MSVRAMTSNPPSFSVRLLARAVVLAAFGWCLFGGNSPEELAAAVIFALGAAAAMEWLRARTAPAPPVPLVALGVFIRRVPAKVLPDLGRLLVALARRHGARRSYRWLPYHTGRRTPVERGRRAVVVTGVSVAPNTIALGVDPRRRRLLVHQLAAAPLPADPQWPL